MLDLVYAFAESHSAFNIAFVKSPVEMSHMKLLTLKQQVASVKSVPSITSPGGAITHLAKSAQGSLVAIMQALYYAGLEHGVAHQSFMDSIGTIHISEAVKAPAHQYVDCAATEDRKVMSHLPDSPSLPEYMPNFVNDTHSTWYRNAQYMFDNIRMPAAAALRGDPLAELIWHRYVSDILHARLKSMNLSEHQVIQHLSQKVGREHQHFVCAQEAATDPHCTVRKWLDTIRDFYFTSGAFRHKLEHAWTKYQATNATDFNDLIHHIKTYYQMIFLDYAHLAGKLHLLDFAWILFSKIQALMQPACMTVVASTLRMFLPLSNLVNKMQLVLTPAQNLSKYEADDAAKQFVIWVIQQLQQVREAANTAQRYTNLDTDINVDFARLGKPQPQSISKNHTPQAAAAVASQRSNQHNGNNRRPGMQPTRPNRTGPSTTSTQPRSLRIQGLKDMVNATGTAADQDIVAWTRDVLLNLPDHLCPPDMKKTLAFLVRDGNGPDTLHGALATVTADFPPRVPRTRAAIIRQYLKTSFLFHKKICAMCPNCEQDPASGQHLATDCPTLRAVLSPDVQRQLVSTIAGLALWHRGIGRQAAAGQSSQPPQGGAQQKNTRYDLRSAKRPRTDHIR